MGLNSLDNFEKTFREFGAILDMDEFSFCKAFRFDVAQSKNDILKIGDTLAEPWVALSLHNFGFQNIRKVPADIKSHSDFTGLWNSRKFAFEVKNSHSAEDIDFYIKLIDSHYQKQDVWISQLRAANGKTLSEQEERLPSRLVRRLQPEKALKKIKEQLENTKQKYNCQATMLIIYFDMIFIIDEFPSIVISNLEKVKAKYSVSDYFACCINNRNLFCTPQVT